MSTTYEVRVTQSPDRKWTWKLFDVKAKRTIAVAPIPVKSRGLAERGARQIESILESSPTIESKNIRATPERISGMLSDEQVSAIQTEYGDGGVSARTLARAYDVSVDTICRLVRETTVVLDFAPYADRIARQAESFWERVSRKSPTKCWPYRRGDWTRCVPVDLGNTIVYVSVRKMAYFLSRGMIPSDMVVRCDCGNTECANPSHLSVGKWRFSGKLSMEQVEEIREKHRNWHTMEQLSRQYGVTQKTISYIVNHISHVAHKQCRIAS